MTSDPIELLDILGNENRRRILQLLSFRPFYFNEIAKRLDVGPKAVIDHLEMLERAGLIECYHDTSRRKYFRIARYTLLEVSVSPHSYGVKAYRCEDMPEGEECEPEDLRALKEELSDLDERRRGLREQMDEVETSEREIKRKAAAAVRSCAEDSLEAEILIVLLSEPASSSALAEKLEVPLVIVEDYLKKLQARGALQKRSEEWTI